MLHRILAIAAAALVSSITLAASAPAPALASAPAPDPARMDQVAQSFVDAKQFMGTVLVARGDQVIFSKAYGSANLELDVPNTLNHKFRIGSVTKQFTAAAILLLEERGKLKLTDIVKVHYPEAPQSWNKVTIYHLLTHTSGIPNFTSFPDYQMTQALPSVPAETVKRFQDKPLEFAPGAEMRYSNSGYVLLGLIIEKVSGTSYASFLGDNIFKPLGMKGTGYDSNTFVIPRRASGYTQGVLGPQNASYINMTIPHAAGGLYSTVADLHRWARGLFGNKVLKPDSLKKMITPNKNDYAMGVAVSKRAGQTAIQHGGGIDGFNSFLAYFPDTQITVVALSNINGAGADSIVEKLSLLAHGQPVVLLSERKTVKVPVATLQKYVGTYQLDPGFDLSFYISKGELFSQATNQPSFQLAAESQTRFYPVAFDATLDFQVDAKGKVTGVRFQQGVRDSIAPRK